MRNNGSCKRVYRKFNEKNFSLSRYYLVGHQQDLPDAEDARSHHVNVLSTSADNAAHSADSFAQRSQKFLFAVKKALYLAYILSTASHAGMFTFFLNVLQCPKYPMATKFLQVKEGEIVSLLQTINIGNHELDQLRDAAVQMVAAAATQLVPPIASAHFILDRLSYSYNVCKLDQNAIIPIRVGSQRTEDDDLALIAALDAVGARPLFSLEIYPMLSEAARRQKGVLAIALLTRHRDSTRLGDLGQIA